MSRIWGAIERATRWRKEIPGRGLVAGLMVAAVCVPAGLTGTADAGSSCDASVTWKDVPPGAVGSGGIDSVQVTSSSGGLSGTLFVRVDVDPKVSLDRLLIDSDDDWSTGMWTSQSDISAAGWDVLIDSWGGLYKHRGNPRTWGWDRASASVQIESTGSSFRYCIPLDAVGASGKTIRITAENEQTLPSPEVPARRCLPTGG